MSVQSYAICPGRGALQVEHLLGHAMVPQWIPGLTHDGMTFVALGVYMTISSYYSENNPFSPNQVARSSPEEINEALKELEKFGLIEIKGASLVLHYAPDLGNKKHVRAAKTMEAIHQVSAQDGGL